MSQGFYQGLARATVCLVGHGMSAYLVVVMTHGPFLPKRACQKEPQQAELLCQEFKSSAFASSIWKGRRDQQVAAWYLEAHRI